MSGLLWTRPNIFRGLWASPRIQIFRSLLKSSRFYPPDQNLCQTHTEGDECQLSVNFSFITTILFNLQGPSTTHRVLGTFVDSIQSRQSVVVIIYYTKVLELLYMSSSLQASSVLQLFKSEKLITVKTGYQTKSEGLLGYRMIGRCVWHISLFYYHDHGSWYQKLGPHLERLPVHFLKHEIIISLVEVTNVDGQTS